jgi:hypothetical protein
VLIQLLADQALQRAAVLGRIPMGSARPILARCRFRFHFRLPFSLRTPLTPRNLMTLIARNTRDRQRTHLRSAGNRTVPKQLHSALLRLGLDTYTVRW